MARKKATVQNEAQPEELSEVGPEPVDPNKMFESGPMRLEEDSRHVGGGVFEKSGLIRLTMLLGRDPDAEGPLAEGDPLQTMISREEAEALRDCLDGFLNLED